MATEAPAHVEAADAAARGVRVFVSYAHDDAALLERLRAHLAVLEREGLISAWDDREILGGENWADEIDERLAAADIILLLVTADFIQSDYCWGKELKRALERNADPKDKAIVIPVILKACDWKTPALKRLQALPQGARPMADWKTEDHFFAEVVGGLRSRIERLQAPGSGWTGGVAGRLRDPLWWRQPRVALPLLLLLVAAVVAGVVAQRAASRADADIALALQALRSGRPVDAVSTLEPACQRLIRRGSCFALRKARLAAQLEQPDELPLERFAAEVQALQARAPDDPDLLLLSAQLRLREGRADGQAQALADIARAIATAGGQYPEAHFVLANLELVAGRHAAALPLLDRALAATPVAPDHYLNARAYARAQTGDTAGAIDDYERSADLGSILSRIEIAPLLWGRSQYERAADQLSAASRAWAAATPVSGRNALPWAFETGERDPLLLKGADEKRCLARWMARAGAALAGREEPATAATDADCGAQATRIRAAVGHLLARAAASGMDADGQLRAAEFARRHRLAPQAAGNA